MTSGGPPLIQLLDGFGLLEGGRWYPALGLVFSDMTRGGVFALPSAATSPRRLVEHRKGIGGLVAHADGGLVISGRTVAHRSIEQTGGRSSALMETADDEQFFNDLTADDAGRVFVGSVGKRSPSGDEGSPGRLYMIDLDGSVRLLADDVLVSNGLGVDPTGRHLYHVDSGRRRLWKFDLATDDYAASRAPFIDTSEYEGVPDGLAVAVDGSIWVAIAGGGVVVGWDARGDRIQEISVPRPLVTSVCFGGDDRRSLFILTGREGDEAEAHDEPPGAVYRTDVAVAGLPSPLARVPLPREP